jgi:hypothetical protein
MTRGIFKEFHNRLSNRLKAKAVAVGKTLLFDCENLHSDEKRCPTVKTLRLEQGEKWRKWLI